MLKPWVYAEKTIYIINPALGKLPHVFCNNISTT